MTTHKERMMATLRGEEVDRLTFAPRLDLWYLANAASGTLPRQHVGRTMNEIARAEGWPIYFRFVDDLLNPADEAMYLHHGIDLCETRDSLCDLVLPPHVEVRTHREGGHLTVEYHTPVGMVGARSFYDVGSQQRGISSPTLLKHLIGSPDDYEPAGYLFENMRLVPNYSRLTRWAEDEIGDDGVAAGHGFIGASPIHQIQHQLIDATQFFIHYRDHQDRMRRLAERMEPLFDSMLDIAAHSPSPVVRWGSNYDEMLTWPPYFERELVPWIRKVAGRLAAAGKLLLGHTDGENEGLMDLIRDCGMHIAESICPAPMTRVSLAEYYRRWSPRLTLVGGIPAIVALPQTSDAEFDAYMDELFRVIAPGNRIVLGMSDNVPPDAIFSRLQLIHDRVQRDGRLPLKVYDLAPAAASPVRPQERAEPPAVAPADDRYAELREDVMEGRRDVIADHVKALLARGLPAADILDNGLIATMTEVGRLMLTGEIFLPEVLLAARAMASAVTALEAALTAAGHKQNGRIVIGTVKGDLHDIGKNLVATVLRGVGFEVIDLGVNVSDEAFCQAVIDHQPNVLCLSALLTTTMMEMPRVIKALEERQIRRTCKVLIGGAPVTQPFAAQIGADGYAANAVEAANAVRDFVAALPAA